MTSVTLETNLSELLEQHPELEQIFDQKGYWLDVQCLDKSDNMLEDAAAICGFDAQEMMDALNAALQAETVAVQVNRIAEPELDLYQGLPIDLRLDYGCLKRCADR